MIHTIPSIDPKKQAKFYLLLLAAAALFSLPSCHTVAGAGQDIESAGDAIEDTAHDAAH